MTRKLFSFEGTDGRVVAPSEAAAAFGSSQQANGTWSFNAARARLEGTTGVRAVVGSVTTTINRFAPAAGNMVMSCGFGMRVEQAPVKTFHAFASLRGSSGPSSRLIWRPDNTIGIRGTGTTTPEVTGDKALVPGKLYWFTLLANTLTNVATLRAYDADTRALASTAVSNGAVNMAMATITFADIGWVNSDPVAGDAVNFDSLILNDGATVEQFPDSWATAAVEGSAWTGGALSAGVLKVWRDGMLSDFASRVG